jgi:hypothetical protein
MENPDLFWGIRLRRRKLRCGTSFRYRLHSIGPTLMMCLVMYPMVRSREILPAWRDFMEAAPEAISSQAYFWNIRRPV